MSAVRRGGRCIDGIVHGPCAVGDHRAQPPRELAILTAQGIHDLVQCTGRCIIGRHQGVGRTRDLVSRSGRIIVQGHHLAQRAPAPLRLLAAVADQLQGLTELRLARAVTASRLAAGRIVIGAREVAEEPRARAAEGRRAGIDVVGEKPRLLGRNARHGPEVLDAAICYMFDTADRDVRQTRVSLRVRSHG